MSLIVANQPAPIAGISGGTTVKCPWCNEHGMEINPEDWRGPTLGTCRICDGAAYFHNYSEKQRKRLWEDYVRDMIMSYPQIEPLVHPSNGRRPLEPIAALELATALA